MWWWLIGGASCLLLVAVIIFFWTTGQRYKVFSKKSLRPPRPLVTDKKQRDDRLKKGEKNSNLKIMLMQSLVRQWATVNQCKTSVNGILIHYVCHINTSYIHTHLNSSLIFFSETISWTSKLERGLVPIDAILFFICLTYVFGGHINDGLAIICPIHLLIIISPKSFLMLLHLYVHVIRYQYDTIYTYIQHFLFHVKGSLIWITVESM